MRQEMKDIVTQCVLVAAGLLLLLAGIPGPLLAAAAPGVAAASTDWPQFGGPNRNWISAETGWRTDWAANPPKTLWKIVVGEGFSTVSVAKGRVYTMGNAAGKDTVFCLDADTGAAVWKHVYPCGNKVEHPGTRCTPTVDGDQVYTLSHEGDLFCLAAADGKVLWTAKVAKDYGGVRPLWGHACSPLVLGDRLILDVGPIVAVEKATGKLLWKAGTQKPAYTSPMAFRQGSETLIASYSAEGPVVVTADGKVFSKAPWATTTSPPGISTTTPLVDAGTLFISTGYGVGAALYQVTPENLKVIWQSRNMKSHTATCVLWKGCLYGFDGQVDVGTLTCIDFKTGERRWTENSVKGGGLMLADGKLILAASSGDIVVAEANPAAYKELGRMPKVLKGTCWTGPVLAGGRIYCRDLAGDLVCLDVRGK